MSGHPRDLDPDLHAALPPLPQNGQDNTRAEENQQAGHRHDGRPVVALAVAGILTAGVVAFVVHHVGDQGHAETVQVTAAPAAPLPAGGLDAPTSSAAAVSSAQSVDTTAVLEVTRRFVTAWTTPGSQAQRRAALTPVASTRLVNTLAPLTSEALPQVVGEPIVAASEAGQVTVTIAVQDQGSAVLALTNTDGPWKVTAVGQEPL